MSNVHLESINESFVRLNTDLSILRELSTKFSFRVDGYQFMTRYKAGVWDGYIRPINTKNGYCPKGLVPKVIQYLRDNDYTYSLDEGFDRFKEKINFDYKTLLLPHEPHDYQLAALNLFNTKKRQVILSATGSGKSMTIYMMIHSIFDYMSEDKKILILVPTVGLVTQLLNDFKDYSVNNKWDADSNVHLIMSGKDKTSNKKIYISTWQSIYNIKDNEYFERFEAVIADECHTCAAASLSAIMERSINAFYRVGVSGTLDGSLISETALIGHFGPIKRVSSTSDLMERNILAKLKIFLLTLKYPDDIVKQTKYFDYAAEMDWIVRNEYRNRYISKLANSLNGNTLILIQYIEKQGRVLEQLLKEICPDKQVHFVYGGTDVDDREAVRKIAESHSNVIILASYPVFQAGVNIRNLPNLILASPTKSVIRLLQSIGRGLRKHEDKEYCRVFDIADDLRGSRKKLNYTLKHCLERLKIYQNEGFDVVEKTIITK